MEKTIGILVGIIVGILLVPIVLMCINKDKKMKTEYDEMQEIIRGKGFKYGFFTGAIYTALLMILQIAKISIPATQEVIYFSIIFIALAVYVGYCVLKGAYFGLNSNRKRFYIFMFSISLINFAVPINYMIDGSFVQEGIITDSCINLMCGMLFFVVGICGVVKISIDAKGRTADEES